MGINNKEWEKRIAIRTDLTGRLVHLTKPSNYSFGNKSFEEINISAVDNLIKILKERVLIGSTTSSGYIVGKNKAVCFQDVPLYSLIQNVEHERALLESGASNKVRYCGVGLSFVKPYVYSLYSGRPVIYEKAEVAKRILPASEWWRIVSLEFTETNNSRDFNIIDWTHEREWRVPGNLEFDYHKGYVQVILYNPSCVKYFLKNCPSEILEKIFGIVTLTSILM